MKNTLLLLFACLCASAVHAQTVTYETAPKKAKASFDRAVDAVRTYQSQEAIKWLQDALKIAPGFTDAYGQMGLCYVEMKNYAAAVRAFEQLKQLDSSGLRPVMVPYSKALAGTGNFVGALQLISQYLAVAKSKNPAAEKLKTNYTFAVQQQHTVPFQPQNLGDPINSKDPEYFPSLTIDSKTLIYTRRVNGRNEDFYISHRDSTGWQPAQNMGEPVNSSFNEGAQNISQDGSLLIFTGCEFPEGRGSCDLYYSEKTATGWTAPKNLGAPVNTRDWESQPCLSADNQTLYFARETPESGADIFVTTRQQNGQWSVPQRLGPNINTGGRETTPFIHADGQTLYFASNGHPGYGGLDIFYSRRQPDGSWGPATNLGYPINTIDEDASLVVEANGKTAYFASDRSDTRGALDIYSFELYPEARPLQTLYVKGYVYDTLSHARLTANIDVIDLQGGYTIAAVRTNENGDFLAPLPVGKDYAFHVNKKGYLFYSDNFSLKTHNPGIPFEKNIPLQPLAANASIILHNIFFDSKAYDLKPASLTELNKLVNLLQDNPTVKIEIAGHTDNVGSDKDNLLLSENRAKAVVKYLTGKGIAASRLTAKGFGETQPIATNDTEDGRAANRRTVFRIISM
ncbi:OmpA family protein [Chitinophaga nivalis]|uniref:OmpA family protein n=1 Tax=Chitinophaga nivalis TaxID=2991709 RepID=A0ABT3ISN3_9BACT|nr:OmpA family protein [Chitinophaga nivalis]MCW3463327.1 OmpA family protein [Chitinophaga nivalis]MCW3486983.1 OmpA family protein [Chitinophaga nivalis]